MSKIEYLNEQIVNLDNEKQASQETYKQEAERQIVKLENKRRQKEELNKKVDPLRKEIVRMNDERDILLEKIADLEKAIGDIGLR